MGPPFYLVLLGTGFALVAGLLVFSAFGWYRSKSSSVVSAEAQQSGAAGAGSQQPQNVKPAVQSNAAAAQSVNLDAFEIKEAKKAQLLERARKRYLTLHPDFTPQSLQ